MDTFHQIINEFIVGGSSVLQFLVNVSHNDSDSPDQSDHESSDSDGTSMVSEDPPVSCSDWRDRFFNFLFFFLLRLGSLSLVEIPDRAGTSDDEVTDTEDESKDPEDSKQVKVPGLSGVVLPLNVSNWPVRSLLKVTNRVKEQSSDNPDTSEDNSNEGVDNWNKKYSLNIIDEVSSSLRKLEDEGSLNLL